MQDTLPGNSTKQTLTSKNKRKITIPKNYIVGFVTFIVTVGVLAGVYSIGYNKGAKNQKAIDAKNQKTVSTSTAFPDLIKNRWSIVGTVEEVSGSLITVKNNKGLVQSATINDKTNITEKNAKKTTIDAVKKGGSVIVIGTKDDNNKYTATMVRIK